MSRLVNEPAPPLPATRGHSTGWTIAILAIPVLAEQLLQFLVGLWDFYLSGHLKGPGAEAATAAIGTTTYVSWLASLIFSLISTGTTAIISRAWGAAEFPQANRIGTVSLLLGGVAGPVYGGLAWFGAPWLVQFLSLSEEASHLTIEYLRWDAMAAIPFSFMIVGAAAMRGTGNMRTPLLIFAFMCGLNVCTSLTFVYGAGPIAPMGASGIILGTFAAKWAGGILTLIVFTFGLGGLKWTHVALPEASALTRRILRIGLPAAVDGICLWCAQMTFLRIIRFAGEPSLKAHFVGIELESLSYLPAFAWGIATATLVGQRLGAGRPAEAIEFGRTAMRQVLFIGTAAWAVFFFGAPTIMKIMHQDPEVQRLGAGALRMLSWFEPLLVVSIIATSGLRGAGETRLPMWITLCSTILIRIPIAWIAVRVLGWGLRGAWIGMCADITVRSLVCGYAFYRGRWANLKV
jgi:MATE family multidrug resistance protein